MKFTRALGVFVCLLGTIAATSAETPEPEFKTTVVAAFKNGLAFVVKQGDVRLEDGGGRIAPIPNATLGSLWLTPNDQGASLDELVAYRYKVPVEHNLTALADVLLANAGKVVTVGYNQKEYTGEVVGFREEEPTPPEPVTPRPTEYGYPMSTAIGSPPARVVPEYLLLKADDNKLLALNIRAITQVTLPAGAVLRSKQEEERKALRFKLKGASGHANLTLGYMQNGLGWTPSYMVTLQDDQTAQITMQAVLVDDAEDLKAADVFFVVGVPNFPFARIPSPMALQQTLLEFIQAASRRDMGDTAGGRFSNALMAQRSTGFVAGGEIGSPSPSFDTAFEELAGAPEEDLFMYSRSGVTLARNERATYNVFSSPVSFEHIYQWEVQDQPRVDAFGNVQNYQNTGTADTTEKNNVWHALRLKNSTRFPWTSAPAMVISGTKPLAQDVLSYTPKGAVTNLKLTIATDIRASHDEHEIDRQRNIERRRGYSYDQVTVEGTLKIKNYKTKDVHLSIADTLRGSVDSQTDNGKAEKLAEAIAADNPMSRLTWEITLKAGEERTITYRYKVWVRV